MDDVGRGVVEWLALQPGSEVSMTKGLKGDESSHVLLPFSELEVAVKSNERGGRNRTKGLFNGYFCDANCSGVTVWSSNATSILTDF